MDAVLKFELIVGEYGLLAESCYTHTQASIEKKPSQYSDNMCFHWSVLAYLRPPHLMSNRFSTYRHYMNKINMIDIEYPIYIKSILKVETLTRTISINVFGYEDEVIYSIRIATSKENTSHQLTAYNQHSCQKHYCIIASMSGLLSSYKDTLLRLLSAQFSEVRDFVRTYPTIYTLRRTKYADDH